MKNAPNNAHSGEIVPDFVGPILYAVCRHCGERKPIEAFTRNSKGRFGRTTGCKPCDAKRAAAVRAADPEPGRRYAREYAKRNQEAVRGRQREWARENVEARREWAAGYREKKRVELRDYFKQWHELNEGKRQAYYRNERQKLASQVAEATAFDVPIPEDIRRSRTRAIRLREWRAANAEKLRAMDRARYWRDIEKSRALARFYAGRRKGMAHWRAKAAEYAGKARKKRALRKAPWHTLRDTFNLRQERRRMEVETGVRHEIDHVYPLVSDLVCGLDVAANMRVVTFEVNRSKANKISSSCLHEFADVPPSRVFWEPK